MIRTVVIAVAIEDETESGAYAASELVTKYIRPAMDKLARSAVAMDPHWDVVDVMKDVDSDQVVAVDRRATVTSS